MHAVPQQDFPVAAAEGLLEASATQPPLGTRATVPGAGTQATDTWTAQGIADWIAFIWISVAAALV